MSKWIRLYSDEDFTSGLAAALPASGTAVGARYYATDTQVWYSWNGTTWDTEGGGAGTWGSITGTLSNQTDLQSALDGKSATGHDHAGVYDPAGTAAAAVTAHDTAPEHRTINFDTLVNRDTNFPAASHANEFFFATDVLALYFSDGVQWTSFSVGTLGGLNPGSLAELNAVVLDANIPGTAIGDLVGVVDIGGGVPGLPALDGSLLTGITAGTGDVTSSESTGTTVNGSLAVFADANGKTIREIAPVINETALAAIIDTPSAPGVLLYDATGNPVVTASPATSGLPLVGKGTGAIPAFEALNIAAISVSGGSPGQIPKINGGGTALEWAADATGGGGGGGPNYAASYTQIADAGTPSTAGQFAVNVGSSADPTAVTRFRCNVTDADGVPQGDFFAGLSANHYFRMWNAADPTEWITYRITSAGGTTYRDLNVTFVARDAGDTVLASGKTWNFHFYSQDNIKRYSQTSYIRHDAYGPNYITYDSATGNLTHHGTSEPGGSSTLATAIAGVPITWSGIVVPATATGGTIKRVSIGGLLTGATGTAQAIVLKMSAGGTKTDTSKAVQPAGTSFKTTVTCSASTWTDTVIGVNSESSLAAGDTFGVLIGEFTQFSGAPTPYWFRITYEWEVVG